MKSILHFQWEMPENKKERGSYQSTTRCVESGAAPCCARFTTDARCLFSNNGAQSTIHCALPLFSRLNLTPFFLATRAYSCSFDRFRAETSAFEFFEKFKSVSLGFENDHFQGKIFFSKNWLFFKIARKVENAKISEDRKMNSHVEFP